MAQEQVQLEFSRQRRERERKEFVGNRDAILFYPDINKTFRDAGIDPTKDKFKTIYQGGGLDLLDKIGIAGGVSKLAGGGIAKEGGVESGVAPESGPTPDGPKGLFSAIKYVKKS